MTGPVSFPLPISVTKRIGDPVDHRLTERRVTRGVLSDIAIAQSAGAAWAASCRGASGAVVVRNVAYFVVVKSIVARLRIVHVLVVSAINGIPNHCSHLGCVVFVVAS